MEDSAEALLRHIIAHASVLEVEGAPTHLLVPVPPELADALAVYGAEAEDVEDGGDWEDSDDVAPASLLRQFQAWKPPPYS